MPVPLVRWHMWPASSQRGGSISISSRSKDRLVKMGSVF